MLGEWEHGRESMLGGQLCDAPPIHQICGLLHEGDARARLHCHQCEYILDSTHPTCVNALEAEAESLRGLLVLVAPSHGDRKVRGGGMEPNDP
jgi:hypothetical protein